MTNPARIFSRVDEFLRSCNPLTPYGRDLKDGAEFITDAERLDRELALTGFFIALLKSPAFAGDKIRWHLKRVPRIETDFSCVYDSAGVFEIKKFLYNASCVHGLLPAEAREELDFDWPLGELLGLLSPDGEAESFYIAADPGSELALLRANIEKLDARIAALKAKRCRLLMKKYGLDFSARQFVVLDAEKAGAYSENDIFFEPHDSASVIAKPVFGHEYGEFLSEREKLALAERCAVAEKLRELSRAINQNGPALSAAVRAVERTDVFLAKALFALENNLVRPEFSCDPDAPVTLENGEFSPLKNRLAEEGLKYTPLNCEFKKRVALIYGSNMGGKTVALQTVAFFQFLAQGGFFVPAGRFKTRIFDAVRFAGGSEGDGADGLSGFGREVSAFNEAYPACFKTTLLLMDEFARTTNSVEARALLSAITGTLAERQGVLTLLATHFADIARHGQAAAWRMRGFDARAFDKYFGGCAVPPAERLRAINRFMRYELIADDGSHKGSDALSVARILGLDAGIIDLAERELDSRRS